MALYQEPVIKARDIHITNHESLGWLIMRRPSNSRSLSNRIRVLDRDGRLDMSLSERGIEKDEDYDDCMKDNVLLGNRTVECGGDLKEYDRSSYICINGRRRRMKDNGLSSENIVLLPSPLSLFMKYKRFTMLRSRVNQRNRMRREMKKKYIIRKVINK